MSEFLEQSRAHQGKTGQLEGLLFQRYRDAGGELTSW